MKENRTTKVVCLGISQQYSGHNKKQQKQF